MGERQRGVALITAILIVAIVAATAAFIALDQHLWLRQAMNLNDRAQADAVTGGGIDWAIVLLAKDSREASGTDHLEEDWARQLPPIPAEGGMVSGFILDAQSRFNVNNLRDATAADLGIFRELVRQADGDPELVDAVMDWLDADDARRAGGAEDVDYLAAPPPRMPSRAGNGLFASAEELRLVHGFPPDLVERLRPHLVALPEHTAINLNTAHKTVLAAALKPLSAQAIDEFVQGRPYESAQKAQEKLAPLFPGQEIPPQILFTAADGGHGAQPASGEGAPASTQTAGVTSQHFLVTVDTRFGHAVRRTEVLVRRRGASPEVLWRAASPLPPPKVAP